MAGFIIGVFFGGILWHTMDYFGIHHWSINALCIIIIVVTTIAMSGETQYDNSDETHRDSR